MLPIILRPKGLSYIGKVIATGPLVYFPLNDLNGVVSQNVGSLGPSANGVYTGATLAQMVAPGEGLAPLFDGVNDDCSIFSAALSAAFNGALGSASIWWKVLDAGVWTDTVTREFLRINTVTGTSFVIFRKTDEDNSIRFYYNAGGVTLQATSAAYNNLSWNHMALPWSKAADQLKWYNNGAQTGATLSGLGDWNSELNILDTFIGNSMDGNHTKGYLAHAAVWDKVLTPAQISSLYDGGL